MLQAAMVSAGPDTSLPLTARALVRHALRAIGASFPLFARIVLVWAALLAILEHALLRSGLIAPLGDAATWLASGIVYLLPASGAALGWYRHLLLGERRLVGPPLRLLALAPFFAVMWIILGGLAGGLAAFLGGNLPVSLGLVSIAVFLIFIGAHVVLVIPALAVGRPMSALRSWQLVQGGSGAVFGAHVLIVLPLLVPVVAILLATGGEQAADGAVMALRSVLLALFHIVFAVLLAGLSAELFRRLAGPQDAAPGP